MLISSRLSASRRRTAGGGGGGGLISASKWRIRATSQYNPTGNLSGNEIEMRATIGGADQCTGGTPISSSDFDGSYANTNAFDNNLSTTWASLGGMPGAWIGYDFGSPVTVAEIRYTPRSGLENEAPYEGFVDYWDGSAWQVAWPLIPSIWTTSARSMFQPVTGSRWRVRCITTSGGFFGLAAVQMRTVSGGADQCSGGVAGASSTYSSGYLADFAFDGNSGTDWASATGGAGNWLCYDFGAAKDIVEFVMTARSGEGSGAGTSWAFERWNVSTGTWETMWTASGSFADGETKVFTKP